MRKLFIGLVLIAVIAGSLFAFVACNDEPYVPTIEQGWSAKTEFLAESSNGVINFVSAKHWRVDVGGMAASFIPDDNDNWCRGEYRFELCSDAESVKLVKTVRIEGESGSPYCDEAEKAYRNANFAGLDDGVFAKMSGQKIMPLQEKAPITLESRFSDFADAGRLGKIVHRAVLGVANRKMKAALKMPEGPEKDNRLKGARFLKRILESNSLMTMTMCAGKRCPYNFAQGLAHLANGRLWQGLRCFFAKIKAPLLPKEKRR